MDKILNYTNENINAKLLGRLPSMIQLPIQEQLDRELGDKSIYNLAMAEFGEKWVGESGCCPTGCSGAPSPDHRVFLAGGIPGSVESGAMVRGGCRSAVSGRYRTTDWKSVV